MTKPEMPICPECGRTLAPKRAQRQLVLLRLEREYLRERLAERDEELAAVEERIAKRNRK